MYERCNGVKIVVFCVSVYSSHTDKCNGGKIVVFCVFVYFSTH
jgi:hypothetical protein